MSTISKLITLGSLMARMDIFRITPKGIKPLAPTSINEHVRRWRKCQEEKGIDVPTWHERQKTRHVENGRGAKEILHLSLDLEDRYDEREQVPIPNHETHAVDEHA